MILSNLYFQLPPLENTSTKTNEQNQKIKKVSFDLRTSTMYYTSYLFARGFSSARWTSGRSAGLAEALGNLACPCRSARPRNCLNLTKLSNNTKRLSQVENLVGQKFSRWYVAYTLTTCIVCASSMIKQQAKHIVARTRRIK